MHAWSDCPFAAVRIGAKHFSPASQKNIKAAHDQAKDVLLQSGTAFAFSMVWIACIRPCIHKNCLQTNLAC